MNYSSRFRVNIGQLQTLLALLYDTLAPQLPRSCHERVEEILADPSGGDEKAVPPQYKPCGFGPDGGCKQAFGHEGPCDSDRVIRLVTAVPPAVNPDRVIRWGDLVVGKRYRIVSTLDGFEFSIGAVCVSISKERFNARHVQWPTGVICCEMTENSKGTGFSWAAVPPGDDANAFAMVTAVELVEDEAEQAKESQSHVAQKQENANGFRMGNSATQGGTHGSKDGVERKEHASVPGGTPELLCQTDQNDAWNRSEVRASDLHVHGAGEAPTGLAGESGGHAGGRLGEGNPVDPAIIRAAEGVVLEPGEYEDTSILGRPFTILGRVPSVKHCGVWVFILMPDGAAQGITVTAVRRVEPQAPKEIPQPASAEASLISTPSRGQHPSCGPEPQAPQESSGLATMTKLAHTHDGGGDCLACDVRHVRDWLYPYRPERTVDEALDRIEAALALISERATTTRIARGRISKSCSRSKDNDT